MNSGNVILNLILNLMQPSYFYLYLLDWYITLWLV